MAAFYKTFLGASVTFESASMAFLTYDDEHHRIALLKVSGTQPEVHPSCGPEHIAFTFASLSDLALAYRQCKAPGVLPIWCVNHGPTASMYCRDPDGNRLETQGFVMGKAFEENPVGTDFDPEEPVRLQKGENEEAVKGRVEIGRRGFETVPLIA
ncbi:Glyoxalase/Bleomycin resistance protein/Dihydroxybiphenyl dioxygenase [Cryomyces antarcticus]